MLNPLRLRTPLVRARPITDAWSVWNALTRAEVAGPLVMLRSVCWSRSTTMTLRVGPPAVTAALCTTSWAVAEPMLATTTPTEILSAIIPFLEVSPLIDTEGIERSLPVASCESLQAETVATRVSTPDDGYARHKGPDTPLQCRPSHSKRKANSHRRPCPWTGRPNENST